MQQFFRAVRLGAILCGSADLAVHASPSKLENENLPTVLSGSRSTNCQLYTLPKIELPSRVKFVASDKEIRALSELERQSLVRDIVWDHFEPQPGGKWAPKSGMNPYYRAYLAAAFHVPREVVPLAMASLYEVREGEFIALIEVKDRAKHTWGSAQVDLTSWEVGHWMPYEKFKAGRALTDRVNNVLYEFQEDLTKSLVNPDLFKLGGQPQFVDAVRRALLLKQTDKVFARFEGGTEGGRRLQITVPLQRNAQIIVEISFPSKELRAFDIALEDPRDPARVLELLSRATGPIGEITPVNRP